MQASNAFGHTTVWNPVSYLNGIGNYNGNVSSPTGTVGNPNYVQAVLGQTQYSNILNGSQSPSGAKAVSINNALPCDAGEPSANLQSWPFKVYGPLGIRIDNPKVDKVYFPGQNNTALIKSLTSFKSGMTMSVSYIQALLKKYQNAPLPSITSTAFTNSGGKGHGSYTTTSPNAYAAIDQTALLDKTIAAWYSNEIPPPQTDGNNLSDTVNQVKKLYSECITCTGQSVPTTNGAVNAQATNTKISQINFIWPVTHPYHIESPFGPRVIKGGYENHKGVDLYSTIPNNVNVLAAASGTVQTVVKTPVDGYAIVIDHGGGNFSLCLDTSSPQVNQGQQVAQGQLIGMLGHPSGATGLHVHFQINVNSSGWSGGASGGMTGTAINPQLPPVNIA